MGLSLWLVPTDAKQRQLLETDMHTLQEAHSHTGGSHPFPPHVTLLSGLVQDEKTIWDTFLDTFDEWGKEESGLQAFTCPVLDITTRGMYFQCILLAIENVPRLSSLHQKVRQAFDKNSNPPYFPHCSLVYAPYSVQEAQSHITAIKEDNKIKAHTMASIELGAVQLWNTNGPVEQWTCIQHLDLSAK